MRRAVVAIAAAGMVAGAAACSVNPAHHGPAQHGGPAQHHRAARHGEGVEGSWAVVSCHVDVTYTDNATTVDYYLPDTGTNFRRHFAHDNSDNASLAVVITLVNHTGGPASLPTGLVVSFTDRNGNRVGTPQSFNNADGTGYGAAIANGRGSGEVFSAGTKFSPGQTVAESPDISAPVPQQPDLNCQVSRQ